MPRPHQRATRVPIRLTPIACQKVSRAARGLDERLGTPSAIATPRPRPGINTRDRPFKPTITPGRLEPTKARRLGRRAKGPGTFAAPDPRSWRAHPGSAAATRRGPPSEEGGTGGGRSTATFGAFPDGVPVVDDAYSMKKAPARSRPQAPIGPAPPSLPRGWWRDPPGVWRDHRTVIARHPRAAGPATPATRPRYLGPDPTHDRSIRRRARPTDPMSSTRGRDANGLTPAFSRSSTVFPGKTPEPDISRAVCAGISRRQRRYFPGKVPKIRGKIPAFFERINHA